jgi:hypothetical protein
MLKLILKPNEVCPYSKDCYYNRGMNECFGARSDRNNSFTCTFFNSEGKIEEGHYRLPQDQTGQMKVLID